MKTLHKKTDEIFHLAANALIKNAPMHTRLETLEWQPESKGYFQPDQRIKIIINDRELKYYAEIKANITKAQKLLLLLNKRECRDLIFITRYVNSELAEELRKENIEFIDTAGNAFINKEPVYIFIKGCKPEKIAKKAVKRAFRAAGLKIIFGFLCNPGLEKETYRKIALVTGVSLGSVGWIIKELEEMGFLVKMGKNGLKLIGKEKLLNRWVTAFPEQLKPGQIIGRYRGNHDWWKKATLHHGAQWGGEVAAEKLTRYLQPGQIIIYTKDQNINRLLLDNRLRADINGDVEILERFWNPSDVKQPEETVHPILVYADLLATGNQRNIETAKMIYEQHIVRLVREN